MSCSNPWLIIIQKLLIELWIKSRLLFTLVFCWSCLQNKLHTCQLLGQDIPAEYGCSPFLLKGIWKNKCLMFIQGSWFFSVKMQLHKEGWRIFNAKSTAWLLEHHLSRCLLFAQAAGRVNFGSSVWVPDQEIETIVEHLLEWRSTAAPSFTFHTYYGCKRHL